MNYLSIIFALLIVSATTLYAQDEWLVPEEENARLSPKAFTDDDVKEGEAIYKTNCLSCHGTPTQGNFLPLNPPPVDPAGPKMQANSDGALAYKIANGRVTMPAFKASLSTSDIWKVIAYFRSFNDAYVQKLAEKVVEEGVDGASIKILLAYLEEKGMIQATVSTDDEELKPISGAEVSLFAKRMFGKLPLSDAKRTNNEGVALFEAPEDLPTNREGNIEVIASLVNEDLYGQVSSETAFEIGAANTKGSLLEKRAMWNTGDKAPLWLLISYLGTVLVVWGFIIYIMLQLRKIFMLGKSE